METITEKTLPYQQVQTLNTLCFADDQVITADSEDNLQMGVFTLQHIAKVWNGNITRKTETMAFIGQDPVRCKIFVENKCLQQANNFKNMGFEVS